MYKDDLYVNLSELSADLWINNNGVQTRYLFEMSPDRKAATLVTKTYDYVDGEFKCTGSIGESITSVDCHDAWRNDTLIWLLRGMWGVPLRYGGKET